MKDFFKGLDISKSFFYRVFLCISEAVSNSIIHGNKNNPSKMVVINVRLISNNLIITIEDEGTGFNFLVLDNPTKDVNIRKEYGRGLFIIKSYADLVEFKKDGKIIKLFFQVGNDVISIL